MPYRQIFSKLTRLSPPLAPVGATQTTAASAGPVKRRTFSAATRKRRRISEKAMGRQERRLSLPRRLPLLAARRSIARIASSDLFGVTYSPLLGWPAENPSCVSSGAADILSIRQRSTFISNAIATSVRQPLWCPLPLVQPVLLAAIFHMAGKPFLHRRGDVNWIRATSTVCELAHDGVSTAHFLSKAHPRSGDRCKSNI
jgi:hypothetical protein